MRGRLLEVGLAAFAGSLLGAGLVGAHGGDATLLHGCDIAGGSVELRAPGDTSCTGANQQRPVDWARSGPTGPAGAQGPAGADGAAGSPGPAYRYRVVRASNSVSDAVKGASASCAADESLVSGGHSGGATPIVSRPDGARGWYAQLGYPDVGLSGKIGFTFNWTANVYAVCAKPVPR
jgi:hypothetical protein